MNKLKASIFWILLLCVNIANAQTQPSSVTIEGRNDTEISIRWNYKSGYTSYDIYRKEGLAGSATKIKIVYNISNSSEAVYTDVSLTPNTEYCYAVGIASTGGYSPFECTTTYSPDPPEKYSISGRVSTSEGIGVDNVLVRFYGGSFSYEDYTNTSGYYTISNVTEGHSGKIEASKTNYTIAPSSISITDISKNETEHDFTATPPAPQEYLTVLKPSNSSILVKGEKFTIQWQDNIDSNVKIELFRASSYLKTLQNSRASDGSFVWSPVSTNLESGTNYQIKISSVEDPTLYDFSTSFTISDAVSNTLGLSSKTVDVTKSGGQSTISVNSNISWTVTESLSWITVNPISGSNNGSFTISTTANSATNGRSGIITVSGGGLTETITITQDGNPQGAAISISPSTLTFGNINKGESSEPMEFTISNPGTEDLNVSSITYPNSFTGEGFESGIISAGGSQNISVKFTPASPMTYVGTITINSDATSGTNTLSVSGTGISDGTCEYSDVNGEHYAYEAVSYLCGAGLLDDDGFCEPEQVITRAALAKLAYLSIGMQQTSYADNFPSPFQDLQDNSTWYYSFAKNLSYLEYGDGIAPFDKTSFNFYASNNISRAHALKVLIETWNLDVTTGTDLPFTDVDVNHDAYKYIYTAYKLGIISDNDQHIFGPDVNVYRGEIFVMLHRMMDLLSLSSPTPTEQDFFIPGNYTPENFATFNSLHSGNFNFYTKTSFAISSIGIPLGFEHTYNSYLTELPDGLTPIKPLGKAWNHPYNSYIMEVPGDIKRPDDFRVIIALPNSGFHVYNLSNGSYVCETKGVYNELKKPTSDKFTVKTKSQVVYTYQKISGSSSEFPYVLKTIHDRNGNTLTINYENSSYKSGAYRISNVTGTGGRKLRFNYHSSTDLVSYITDPIGRKVYFNFDSYDIMNNEPKLVSFNDAMGNTSVYNYGNNAIEEFLLLSIQLPKGNVITNTYEDKKLVSTQTNGDNPTTFNYTRNYNQSSSQTYTSTVKTDPFNKQTTINYNKNGNASFIESETSTVSISYNNTHDSKPASMDVNGKFASYTYDNMGNVLSMNMPLGVSHQFTYNSKNDVTSYTDPRGKLYSYSYDGNGNMNQANTPRGSTLMSYNSNGLVTSTTNPSGIKVTYTYDSYGNLKSSNAPEGIKSSSVYDMASRLKSSTNPNGQTISYAYDANDNLLSETLNGQTTSYGFDLNDNLTSITNANGGVTSMVYGFQKDFLTSVSFGGNSDRYTYEDDGRLKTHTDPKGQTFTNAYDSKGRLESVSVGNQQVSYIYDANNNITSATNSNGTISFTYDELNRVTSTTDFWGNQVVYTYDKSSNVKNIKYPGDKLVTYEYDDDNLLHSVTDWNNNTTTYTYRDDGALLQTNYPNGTSCTNTYDNAGRLIGMSWKKADNSVINKYNFALDPMGNHLTEEKIEPFDMPTLASQDVTYTYNSVNRIKQAGTTNFSFDANGNTKTKASRSYTYDNFDRLTNISGDINAQYTYDASGNRRSNTSSGIVKRYVLDILGMANVLLETDGSNSPLNYYIYGLGLISRIDANNNTHYYHYDFRGSTIAMTNASAQITHKYQYGDYGNITQIEEVDDNPFRYVGKYGVMYEVDDLYFMRARYYDVEIGRFISEDPIWNTNLYPYADNNPIVGIDPFGEENHSIVDAALHNENGIHAFHGKVDGATDFGNGNVYIKQEFTVAEIETFDLMKRGWILDGGVTAFKQNAEVGVNDYKAKASGGIQFVGLNAKLDLSKLCGVEFYGTAGFGLNASFSIGKETEIGLGGLKAGARIKINEDSWMYWVGEMNADVHYNMLNKTIVDERGFRKTVNVFDKEFYK